jgi:hypothetical protein
MLAKDAAASFAQVSPLSAHAGGNPLNVGNFGVAQPQDIRRAKPLCIFLRERPAG